MKVNKCETMLVQLDQTAQKSKSNEQCFFYIEFDVHYTIKCKYDAKNMSKY